jgi:redox-sensing transcriptional repressor
MSIKIVPDIVVGRLPIYLRALRYMKDKNEKILSSQKLGPVEVKKLETTSSQELGESVGISAAQIRKDLSQFGGFGTQGTGYRIDKLIERLSFFLKVDRVWEVAVIGAGDMGHALTRYQGFSDRGFKISAVFDNNPEIIGNKIGDLVIQSMDNMATVLRKSNISIAMLTVPASVAQEVTDLLVDADVKAILNYAPININVPDNVVIQYIDPSLHLQRMTYYL